MNQSIQIENYSEKSFVVFGETKPIKELLQNIGGKFNRFLKRDGQTFAGWVFSKKQLEKVKAELKIEQAQPIEKVEQTVPIEAKIEAVEKEKPVTRVKEKAKKSTRKIDNMHTAIDWNKFQTNQKNYEKVVAFYESLEDISLPTMYAQMKAEVDEKEVTVDVEIDTVIYALQKCLEEKMDELIQANKKIAGLRN